MARARLEGGPIRFNLLSAPTDSLGTPMYDGDVVEWMFPEVASLVTPGGIVLASTGIADAKLWVIYFR